MPQVSPPVPSVPRFVRGTHKLRKARGFSLGELKRAGVQKSKARSVGIRVDERRSTVHSHNVTALTTFLAPPTQVSVTPEATVEPAVVVAEAKKAPERPKKKKAKRSAKPAKKREH
jgi:hypothetical protein